MDQDEVTRRVASPLPATKRDRAAERPASTRVLPLSAVRAALVAPGDLRNEIGFQNDLNALLASLETASRPFALAAFPMLTSDAGQRRRRRGGPNATTARLRAFGAEVEDQGSVPLALLP